VSERHLVRDERRIGLDDGARTTLQRWGERGPLLLCVHGMTSSRRSWERLATRLAGRFRVAAYDQRGHGDSAFIAGPMSLERGVRDLQNVATALDEPIEAYIGHSWGGAVAIRAGLHSNVERVAAIDPMIRQVDDTWYGEYLEELSESFALTGDDRDRRTREDYADWAPEDVEGKVHAVHAMTVVPIEGLRRENTPQDWDLREEIARYDRPLWLALADPIGSINDRATLDEVAGRHSPLVKITAFPGQGHNLHRTDFDTFARDLAGFLEAAIPTPSLSSSRSSIS
jgi:pimeloyl-ACP methyl ester carboxylesterase